MPILNEQEIIRQAKSGDQTAFRLLVEGYQSFVYSIAFRFVRDVMQAEDLAQDTFIRIWKNLDKYNAEYKVKTWIGRIIVNLCLDYLKSNETKSKRMTSSIDDSLELKIKSDHSAEIDSKELQLVILRLAELLDPKQKAAFILRDVEALEVDEVCSMLNESSTNLKSNLYYARKKIREGLLKYYKTSPL